MESQASAAGVSDRILVVCEDLFFWARIEATAQTLGARVVRVPDEAAMEAAFREGGVRRILADLATRSPDVFRWAARWKAHPCRPELVAFGSHVDADANARARTAGYDRVMARSSFSRDLRSLLGTFLFFF